MNHFLHFLARMVVARTVTELTYNGTLYCSNPIPGLDRLVTGVDITQLDLRHDYSVDHIDGFKQKILDLTCAEGKSWISPSDGTRYDVPDQVNEVLALPAGLLIGDSLLETNSEEVRSSMAVEAGLDLNLTFGMFSASLSYKHSQSLYTNSSKFIVNSKGFVSTTQVDFIPSQFLKSSLNKYWLESFNQLPDKYEANPALFEQFLQTYGTHYYPSGYFGGTLMVNFEVDSAYRKATSDKEVKANAAASFLGILKAHGAYDGDTGTVSEAFKQATHNVQRYFGGVANLFDKEGFTKWWPTVFKNPWLYGGKLRPITDLMDAGPKREAIQTATEVYVRKTYLQEIIRIAASFQHKGYVLDNVMPAFISTANTYAQKVIPTEAEVEFLGKSLNEYVFTPDWFSKETSYCIRWTNPYKGFIVDQCAPMLGRIPDFDHCGGDHIDKDCYRAGPIFTFGAAMSPNAPPWWANVTVSYNDPAWTNCLRFNVPPIGLWLANVKLCHIRDGVPFCAVANQWACWGPNWHNHMIIGVQFFAIN